jgi:hypothetical protein
VRGKEPRSGSTADHGVKHERVARSGRNCPRCSLVARAWVGISPWEADRRGKAGGIGLLPSIRVPVLPPSGLHRRRESPVPRLALRLKRHCLRCRDGGALRHELASPADNCPSGGHSILANKGLVFERPEVLFPISACYGLHDLLNDDGVKLRLTHPSRIEPVSS